MTTEEAERFLQTYAGLSAEDAVLLVQAVVAAATREALEWIAGDGPIPTTIADARALRLRYICESLGRVLTPREIEVVFRTSPRGAVAIDSRLRSSYAQAVDDYLRRVVHDSATVTETGNAETGFRYEIYFDEPAGLEYAKNLLDRRGLRRDVRVRRTSQILDVPRVMDGAGVLEVLGISS